MYHHIEMKNEVSLEEARAGEQILVQSFQPLDQTHPNLALPPVNQ